MSSRVTWCGAAFCAMSLAPAVAHADLDESRGLYVHLLGTAELGRSLRFNNPYRLASPLGKTAESVSLAATYSDFGIGALLGPPTGFQHGLYVHWSTALSGILQDTIAPSYILLWRPEGRLFAYGRVGFPIVLDPDTNVGLEAAGGAIYHFTSGIGATAELSWSGYYGAATREVSATLIPLLSLQLGVSFDLELLP